MFCADRTWEGLDPERRLHSPSLVMMKEYAIRTSTTLPFAEAAARAREVLAAEGFGVLTEIDMQAKLKEKTGADIQPYLILGACNPPLAQRALQSELEIGLFLPCNVIVYEEMGGRTIVAAMDPMVMADIIPNNKMLRDVAKEARAGLERAIAAI
jgi:uncharacterized protein (DUF302 family)